MGGGYIGRGISCLRLPVSTPEGTPYNPYSNEYAALCPVMYSKTRILQVSCIKNPFFLYIHPDLSWLMTFCRGTPQLLTLLYGK